MNLKVGDKVRIKTNLKLGKWYGHEYFVDGMDEYAGEVCTVSKVNEKNDTFFIKEDDELWHWTEKMCDVVGRSK